MIGRVFVGLALALSTMLAVEGSRLQVTCAAEGRVVIEWDWKEQFGLKPYKESQCCSKCALKLEGDAPYSRCLEASECADNDESESLIQEESANQVSSEHASQVACGAEGRVVIEWDWKEQFGLKPYKESQCCSKCALKLEGDAPYSSCVEASECADDDESESLMQEESANQVSSGHLAHAIGSQTCRQPAQTCPQKRDGSPDHSACCSGKCGAFGFTGALHCLEKRSLSFLSKRVAETSA